MELIGRTTVLTKVLTVSIYRSMAPAPAHWLTRRRPGDRVDCWPPAPRPPRSAARRLLRPCLPSGKKRNKRSPSGMALRIRAAIRPRSVRPSASVVRRFVATLPFFSRSRAGDEGRTEEGGRRGWGYLRVMMKAAAVTEACMDAIAVSGRAGGSMGAGQDRERQPILARLLARSIRLHRGGALLMRR